MTHTNSAPRKMRVKFVITSLPVGGAEVLLYNLISRMNRDAFDVEVVCLKEAGAMGPQFAEVARVHTDLLRWKYDATILPRLSKLLSDTDAVVTVGAGDKMFWGRLAAKLAKVPVICSALHSTGWPDGVGRLNRLLTPITTAFIACANQHAEHLSDVEGFPRAKVHVVPNGVNVNRFRPAEHLRSEICNELEIPRNASLIGIVAALREEKNHKQFLAAANRIIHKYGDTAHFLIVGDGPERALIEDEVTSLGIGNNVHLLGSRQDTDRILPALDVFCLTSKMEANPVSILEALSCGVPVVAPNVGSISESVLHGKTGYLTQPLCHISTSEAVLALLDSPADARKMGVEGRLLVTQGASLEHMVQGYENLLTVHYNAWRINRDLGEWNQPACGVDGLGQRLLEEAHACQLQTEDEITPT